MRNVVFLATDPDRIRAGLGLANDADNQVAQILDDLITAVHDEAVRGLCPFSENVLDIRLAVRTLDATGDDGANGKCLVGLSGLVFIVGGMNP